MNNRNTGYTAILTTSLVVLFSLMYATSLAVQQAPFGL